MTKKFKFYVNTIEFNGKKTVLNSYGSHPALIASMKFQREKWSSKYPKAIVRTELMTEADIICLVKDGEKPHVIGATSSGLHHDPR